MPGAEAEIDQLPRAALDIFRRGAVVEYEQGVGAREEVAGHPAASPRSRAAGTRSQRCSDRDPRNPCMSCS